jgi:hypothetical protein
MSLIVDSLIACYQKAVGCSSRECQVRLEEACCSATAAASVAP